MIQTSIDIAKGEGLAAACLGLDRPALRQLLGEPETWGMERDPERAAIWRFGGIEFHFQTGKVWLIFSDHGTLADGGNTLRIDPWVVRPGLEQADLESAMRAAGIPFEIGAPSGRVLRTTGGATLTFAGCDEGKGVTAWSVTAP